MSSELVVGVDCSTTACKAIAWDSRGQSHAEGREPIDLHHPAPDAWEQDAEQWWAAWRGAIRQVTYGLGERAASIQALCIAHQRETIVLADDEGTPLHPALVWMDLRCHREVREATERLGADRLHELSGKPPCTTPSLYKLMYLLGRRPDLARSRPKVLDVHAFVVWRATGRYATSLASADPTGLIDMRARSWSPELLALAGLDEQQLPELLEPGVEIGRLDPQVAESCGLPPGLPIIAGAGDGQAAGLGVGLRSPGSAYVNLGTAVVAGVFADRYHYHPSFRTLYGAVPGTYLCESDLKGGSFTLTWLVDKVLRADRSDARPVEEMLADLEIAARSLPSGSEGVVLVPYWNGVMNPYWDDDATGMIIGLTGSHRPEHLYRAALEGIAFEQRLALDGIAGATSEIDELIVVGGGAKSALWCQILADVTGRAVVRAATYEATALGAGMMAAVASGMHADSTAAVRAMTHTAERFEPGPARHHYAQLFGVYRDLYPALRQPLGRLAAIRRGRAGR